MKPTYRSAPSLIQEYTTSSLQESDPDKFDRAKVVEVLTAPYIEDSGGGIVALDPHALKKLFTTTISLLQASTTLSYFNPITYY